MTIRTRFAPSPTGPLHIGGARSALFNYLFAKKHGGAFVLRIEDTDLERSDLKYETEIFESFRWLGIEADESPERGGPYAPYRQSERLPSYRACLERLLASGSAFYCPHAEAELEAERRSLMASGKNPVHRCEFNGQAGQGSGKGIIRFKTPMGRTVAFTDLIRGEISFASDLLGDFSLAKRLDVPLYNFAVVVDDHEMAITHVIRGEDHIPNTPKQLLIAEALGIAPPTYAHLPLILSQNRAKLSKRHGATSIREFREEGYLPEALVNFMALLGWNPGDDREIFSLAELADQFDIGKVQKSAAIFNIEKLDWLNGEYIRRKSPQELADALRPYLEIAVADAVNVRDDVIVRVAAIEQPRLKKLSEIGERTAYFFREPHYETPLLRWKEMSDGEIRQSLERARSILAGVPDGEFTKERLEHIFLDAIGGGDKGVLLWPLRVALSGRKASPGPFEIMDAMGKGRSIQRIDTAIAKTSRAIPSS